MRAAVLALLVALAGCTPPPPSGPASPLVSTERFAARTWTFDGDTAGAPPSGTTVHTGAWAVRAENGTPTPPNALCQTGSADFPAITLSAESHRDMKVTAMVKPISGSQDRAAGVLLRLRDAKNYYIVRANALEGSVVIFKYVNGSRSEIKSGAVTVPAGEWHQLRGEVAGATLRGYWDGRLIVEATDQTFAEGGVGLWTKADSTTCFDDVELGPVG